MAKLTGVKISERANELKTARMFAFNLWQENPQISKTELDQALIEKGFEVARNTYSTWLTRFKRAKSRIHTIHTRARSGPRPRPARILAFKLWQENPQITAIELSQKLREQGFHRHISSYFSWLTTFRKGKDIGTYEKPAPGESSEITLEQIIKAAGSVETLSLLFYQGVMQELTRKDDAYHVLKQDCHNKDNKISKLKQELDDATKARNKIMTEWNEKLAKVKVGTLTLDQTTHRLVPKTY